MDQANRFRPFSGQTLQLNWTSAAQILRFASAFFLFAAISVSAHAALIGVDVNLLSHQRYSLTPSDWTEIAGGPYAISGSAVSDMSIFLGGVEGCGGQSCQRTVNYSADLSGLSSDRTSTYLASLQLPLVISELVGIQVRASDISDDAINVTFLALGPSTIVQVDDTTRLESRYSKSFQFGARGSFFNSTTIPVLVPGYLESLWSNVPFSFAGYEESFYNATLRKDLSGNFAYTSISGEKIVSRGTDPSTFRTFTGTVPAPSTVALLCLGLAGLAASRRHRQ